MDLGWHSFPLKRLLVAGCLVLVWAEQGLHGTPAGASSAPTGEPSARLLASTVALFPTQDAFVASAEPNANYGTGAELSVGQRSGYGATRTVLQFDLNQLKRNEVPVGGRLRLYLRQAGPVGDPARDIVLYRLREAWDEKKVTWQNFPGFHESRVAATGIGTTSGWYTWDVDSLVRGWYVGRWRNHGVYVQGYEAAGSHRIFGSRESGNRPQLVLEVEIDRLPPTVALNPLPPYVNTPEIRLTWPEAVDPEPSSLVDFYELWMQRNDDPWRRLATEVRERTYLVQGLENGCRYRFRVLAVDRAGNRQPEGDVQAETIVDLSPPVVRLEPLPEWSTGPVDLRWTGTDEPSGGGLYQSGIDVYFVEYNINETAWGPLASEFAATTYRFTPTDGLAYQFRVTARDRAGNLGLPSEPVARTKADLRPPTVRFEPTSGVDRPTFRVRWMGDDGGGSGIAGYDIQYRVGEHGAWTVWLQDSRETFRDFSGEYGRWYYFRGRARDIAGNRGDYPAQPQLGVPVIESARLTFRRSLPLLGR